MQNLPNGVYRLDPTPPLSIQVLRLAGWYEGRKVDISEQEKRYEQCGCVLTSLARETLSEIYGLPYGWYFRHRKRSGFVGIGGYEYWFDTKYNDGFIDDCQDKNLLPADIRDSAIPILCTGWHQFDSPVWVGKDNLFYRVHYLKEDLETFSTLHELLEDDMMFCLNDFIGSSDQQELYVTFTNQDVLHWD